MNTQGPATMMFDPQKVVRRLAAAEGYLELGLPTYALGELNEVNDAGPFEPIAALFRGEALQAQERYAEAIGPLNRAAELFPAPFNQRALLALSNCYHHEGQDRLALEVAEAIPQQPPPGTKLVVVPIFHVEPPTARQGSGDSQ